MLTIFRTAFVVLCVLIPSAVLADGLIYQLPADGTWARFDFDGTGGPDGKVVLLTASVTLSSVGTAEVDGEPCRWIEIAMEGKKDGQPFTAIHKLLIPEKQLGKGKDPLEHVRKAWFKHSMIADGTLRQIEDLKGTGARELASLRTHLHGPFKTSEKLDNVAVESKLGKLECEGLTFQEKTGEPGKVSSDSTSTIRLHATAPFGVVTHEITIKFERDGQSLGTMTLKMKLSDFGKDAKSALPDSK
jgi:hypothetical protein